MKPRTLTSRGEGPGGKGTEDVSLLRAHTVSVILLCKVQIPGFCRSYTPRHTLTELN